MKLPTTIGFIGDGQLARMSACAAIKLGYKCHFFGNSSDGPCSGLGEFFPGSLDDLEALRPFIQSCDVVTLENEFIDSKVLMELVEHTPIYPSPESFQKIENKLIEKDTFKNAGIPVCHYALTNSIKDLERFMINKNFPVMLKAAKGGYDGFGNYVAKNMEDAQAAIKKFKRSDSDLVIAEEMMDFKKEVAVTVARSITGEIKVYPVVDTIQVDSICHYVVAPAAITEVVSEKIKLFAIQAMESLNAIGVFSFEFFIMENAEVLLNESAPRPHNSAHYTMDGCETSQFENHIRAITGMPLGDVDLKADHTVMVNLIGTHNRKTRVEQIDEYIEKDNINLHMYGKTDSRVGRKMGHINILGNNTQSLLATAKEISEKVRI